MPVSPHGPDSHSYFSHRLRLHYVDWGNEGAPPVLMVHGGQDHCRNWDWLARALRDDYHVIAPDLRGHGDSQWMLGGSYSIQDYVFDIAQLIHQRELAPLTLIGHSMGGTVCLQYAGVYPHNVSKLVSLDGFGPSPKRIEARMSAAPDQRMRDWVDRLRELAGRRPRRYGSLEECVARMREANTHLNAEQARHLTIHGVNQNEDGTYSWKFDNYVRAFAPHAFHAGDMHAIWENIECPTLFIRGTESWTGDPATDGRGDHFKNLRIEQVENAGHWVHHDQLDVVIGLLRDFL